MVQLRFWGEIPNSCGVASWGMADTLATASRSAMRLTRDALRQVRGGHPWIFDGSVRSIQPAGSPGDLAVIFDDRRRFAAIGLLDPTSPIRVRVLHRGRPTAIDRGWLRERLVAAADLRDRVQSPHTTGFRWVHGENDGLGGLVVDRYDDVVAVKVYTTAWFSHLPLVADLINELVTPRAIVLRLARNIRPAGDLRDGATLWGASPTGGVRFVEAGLRFEADVVAGPKTGWFCDQRDNRVRVRARAAGRRVLDVCCSGGGFSINAAAGGATLVHSVDIAPAALEATRTNFALNADRPNVAKCHHDTTVGDARHVMADLARSGAAFDLVIVDPPSFTAKAAQRDAALVAYAEHTRAALRLLDDGGTLVQASCSSHVTPVELLDTVRDAAVSVGATLVDPLLYGHADDHPIGFPEGRYLAAVFARVERGGTRGRSAQWS